MLRYVARNTSEPDVTIEAWTIIGTGLTLAALNIALFKWLHGDLADMKKEIKQLGERLLSVEKEQARTSGLLEGLGLTGRMAPAVEPGAD